MSARAVDETPRHIHAAYVAELSGRLSERDRAIAQSLARVRCLTSEQIERLHFWNLSERTRARTRRAVLRRLAARRVVATLERQIGGVRGGSRGLVFTLDVAGQRLVAAQDGKRPRRPWTPGQPFLAHTLAVAEVYVSLSERARGGGFVVEQYMTEPACWWPNGLHGWLKPDAFVLLANAEHEDAWWLEVDMATESGPTVARKLGAYLDFVRRGQRGPGGMMPRVLVVVPDEKRQAQVWQVMRRLQGSRVGLIEVVTSHEAADYMVRVLQTE